MQFDKFELIFFLMGLLLTVAGFALVYFMLPKRLVELFEVGHTIKVDDWDIHYRVQGEGPPVLLIHGLGANLNCWHDVAKLLAANYKVISVDLPGFGLSTKNVRATYGLDDQVDRLEKFLTAINIETCFLVGNSMGGNLALWLAKTHPKRFPYVVAIAPAAHPKLIPWGALRLGFLAFPASMLFGRRLATKMHVQTLGNPSRMNPRNIDQTLSVYRRQPKAIRTFVAALHAISDPRIGLETFESNVLVLYGERDTLVPRWVIDGLMPRISDARLEVHAEGGHQLQEDDPEWVTEKINHFFPASI